jgi:hypothetical protein
MAYQKHCGDHYIVVPPDITNHQQPHIEPCCYCDQGRDGDCQRCTQDDRTLVLIRYTLAGSVGCRHSSDCEVAAGLLHLTGL